MCQHRASQSGKKAGRHRALPPSDLQGAWLLANVPLGRRSIRVPDAPLGEYPKSTCAISDCVGQPISAAFGIILETIGFTQGFLNEP
jgi:hypothetical protein